MHSTEALEVASRLGLKLGKPNLEVFADTLLDVARADAQVVAVTSDSRGSGRLVRYGETLPRQMVEVGIAEQNLVGIAAGLAAGGKKVFAVSPACFVTARSLEQVKNDVAYSDFPVVVVGISAGVSYGALGSTHHSLHDLAALRAINNITLVVPADNAETRAAVRAAAVASHPVYLRFGKAPLYDLPGEAVAGDLGDVRMVRSGSDAAFIATGETVIHALLAAEQLAATGGPSCSVLSVPCVRPLDRRTLLSVVSSCRAVVTVEEHMVNGGLGEACAALLLQSGLTPRFDIAGIPDEYTVPGSQADIFRHYGISMEGLSERMRQLLSARMRRLF